MQDNTVLQSQTEISLVYWGGEPVNPHTAGRQEGYCSLTAVSELFQTHTQMQIKEWMQFYLFGEHCARSFLRYKLKQFTLLRETFERKNRFISAVQLLNKGYLKGEVRSHHMCPPTPPRWSWLPGRLIDRKLFGMGFDLVLTNRDSLGPLPHHIGYFRWPISMPDF